MIEEIWKDILGYEGLYQVSSFGRVRSLDRYDSNNHFLKGRILRLCADAKGYLIVGLWSNNKKKMYKVHRMVAESFIPNPDNLPIINHKDENPSNDNVDNLEWCDYKYNNNYGTARERARNTKLKNGYWTGLSKEEYMKKWRQENKEKICDWKKEYNYKNRDKINEWHREYMKKYYREHKDKMNEYQKEYRRKKRLEKDGHTT